MSTWKGIAVIQQSMYQQAAARAGLQAGGSDSWYRVHLNLVPTDHLGLLLNLDSTFVISEADAVGTLPFWPRLPLTSCDAPYLPCQFLLPDMLPPPPGLCTGCILGPACPPPLPSSIHFNLIAWMSSLEKMIQMRSRSLLPICTALGTSPSEWSSQLEFYTFLSWIVSTASSGM